MKLKFKFVFITFNIILFLLTICLTNLAPPIWLFSGLFLIIVDIFYFSNSRLFILLERGDYPALSGYLEMRVLKQGHYFSPLVRLLANTCLAMADTAAVMSLENKAALVKPALLESNALVFGSARLLGGDISGAVRFFAARLNGKKARSRNQPWVRWYYGFSLLLDRQFNPAAEQFRQLAEESSDTLIVGLSAYFLGTSLQRNADNGIACLAAAQEGCGRVQKAVQDKTGWLAKAGKLKHEAHTLILQKYIEEAGDWLF